MIAGKRADPGRRVQEDPESKHRRRTGGEQWSSLRRRWSETKGAMGGVSGNSNRVGGEEAGNRKQEECKEHASSICRYIPGRAFAQAGRGRVAAGVCMPGCHDGHPIEQRPWHNGCHPRRALRQMGQLLKCLSAPLSKPPHTSRVQGTTHSVAADAECQPGPVCGTAQGEPTVSSTYLGTQSPVPTVQRTDEPDAAARPAQTPGLCTSACALSAMPSRLTSGRRSI